MRSYEEYKSNPIPRTGRRRGTSITNKIAEVYRRINKDGRMPVSLPSFRSILDTVADVFWKRVYAGNQVSIPYLCNFEIIPAESIYTPSINWVKTHQLWNEDREAYEDRLLVRNRPNRYKLKVRHSTISFNRRYWYISLMLKIRPVKSRLLAIEDKYEL